MVCEKVSARMGLYFLRFICCWTCRHLFLFRVDSVLVLCLSPGKVRTGCVMAGRRMIKKSSSESYGSLIGKGSDCCILLLIGVDCNRLLCGKGGWFVVAFVVRTAIARGLFVGWIAYPVGRFVAPNSNWASKVLFVFHLGPVGLNCYTSGFGIAAGTGFGRAICCYYCDVASWCYYY